MGRSKVLLRTWMLRCSCMETGTFLLYYRSFDNQ